VAVFKNECCPEDLHPPLLELHHQSSGGNVQVPPKSLGLPINRDWTIAFNSKKKPLFLVVKLRNEGLGTNDLFARSILLGILIIM
jgi:hypothetical protein